MRDEQTPLFTMQKLELLHEEPNLSDDEIARAWQRMQAARLPARTSSSRAFWPLAAAAGLTGILLLTPTGRATAEAVWQSLTLTRVENISLDFSKTTMNLVLPNVFPLRGVETTRTQHAKTATEATDLAGFPVRSLRTPYLPFTPSIRVTEEPELKRTIDLAAIETDLRQMGRRLPALPAGVDGAEIRLKPASKVVSSSYGECPQLIGPWKACAVLIQSRPMTLQLPPQLSVEDYVRFSLELAGFSGEQIEALARLHRKQPTLFVPLETTAELRQVHVRGTTGTLVVYAKTDSADTAFLLDWLEDGFYFRIFGRNPSLAVDIAETLQ
jgi:hypothetical protein